MSTPSPDYVLKPLNADPGAVAYIRQMWDRRHLAIAIPLEEIKVSHQNTFLGSIWHLGNPMLTVGVYYVIFGQILNTNRGIDNFLLWLMIGVFGYHFTSKTVLAGAKSISTNQGLMRSIRFPRALLPVSVVVEHFLTFLFELAILAAAAIIAGQGISKRWVALPLVVLLQVMLNLGGAFITARLNDAFQDIQQIIPFLFRLGTYATGVMFPIERFTEGDAPGWALKIIMLNPLVTILQLYRWIFLGTALDMGGVIRSTVFAVALVIFGFRFFRVAEHRYGRA